MSVPKRTPPGFVLDEKSSLKSISLTPRLSLSQNTDYPSKGWYRYQTVSTKESFNRQRTPLRFERRAGIQSKSKSTNRKATNSAVEQTHVSDDDEWVKMKCFIVLEKTRFIEFFHSNFRYVRLQLYFVELVSM